MQPISIADKLWLEPTLLGVTLNFSDITTGRHYRVGIGFKSLAECDEALLKERVEWRLQDRSLLIEGDLELTLTFCPGTQIEKKITLAENEMAVFKNAMGLLGLHSEARNN